MISYEVHCDICGHRSDGESPLDIDNGFCEACGDAICQFCTTKEHEDIGIVHIGCYDDVEKKRDNSRL